MSSDWDQAHNRNATSVDILLCLTLNKIPNIRNYDFLTPEEAEEVNFLFTMYGKKKSSMYSIVYKKIFYFFTPQQTRLILSRASTSRSEEDIDFLLKQISSIEFIKKVAEEMGRDTVRILCKYLSLERFKSGQTIFKLGNSI